MVVLEAVLHGGAHLEDGGEVADEVAAGHGVGEGGAVADIAADQSHVAAGDAFRLVVVDQDAHVVAAVQQLDQHPPADAAGPPR